MDIRQNLQAFISDKTALIKCSREVENLGTVYFRSLPGTYVMKLIPRVDAEGNEIIETQDDNITRMMDIICKTSCDEKGNLLFVDEFEAALDDMSIEMINELAAGGMEASGLSKVIEEEAEKNLEPTV